MEGQERVYLTAHLGHLQGVQKPRVRSAHDFAFRFLIFFFIFNLERKKKVYGEGKRNFTTSGALVFTRQWNNSENNLPVFHEPRRRLK